MILQSPILKLVELHFQLPYNELAKELYNLGMFNPQMADQALLCLEMMNFEGREKIMEKIKANASRLSGESAPVETAQPSGDESYRTRAYRHTLPGRATLAEAARRLGK